MTVDPAPKSNSLSVLRVDRPVDNLPDLFGAAGQTVLSKMRVTMWRSRDGLAARLRAGAAPAQALADWGCQTTWDLAALESDQPAVLLPALAQQPEDKTLGALSFLFADALLNSAPEWHSLARAWDERFETSSDKAGSGIETAQGLSLSMIELAHANLTELAETAARAHLETGLARAGRQAEYRTRVQAAQMAQAREAVLAAALLDRMRDQGFDDTGDAQ